MVAVIALPESSSSTLPVSSTNETATPATPVPDPPAPVVARPVSVLPHWAIVGAWIVKVDESSASAPPGLVEPDATGLVVVASRLPALTCTDATEHGGIVVGERHSWGASPIAERRPDAVRAPETPVKSTTKLGVCPVESSTSKADRSTAVPGVSEMSDHPGMVDPPELRTVSLADVKPVTGVSSVKDLHAVMAPVAEQPMRGTEVAPEKTVRCGAMSEHPAVLLRMLKVLMTLG